MIRTITLLSILLAAGVAAIAAPVAAPMQQVSSAFTSCCGDTVGVWTESGYFVFWSPRPGKVHSRRIATDGRPADNEMEIGSSTTRPIVASDGKTILVLTSDAHVPGAVAPVDAIVVSVVPGVPHGAAFQLPAGEPLAAVFDGRDYVIAIREPKDASGSRLRLMRVAHNGTVIHSQLVDFEPAFNPMGRVALSTNGSDFVMVWADAVPTNCSGMPCVSPSRLRVLTFQSLLELTGHRGTIVAADGIQPSVVWTGFVFVTTWTDVSRVLSLNIDPASDRIGAPRAILQPPALVFSQTAAWDGEQVSVLSSTPFFDPKIYLVRLDRFGEPLDDARGVPVLAPGRYFTALTLIGADDGHSLMTFIFEKLDYFVFSSLLGVEQPGRRRAATRN